MQWHYVEIALPIRLPAGVVVGGIVGYFVARRLRSLELMGIVSRRLLSKLCFVILLLFLNPDRLSSAEMKPGTTIVDPVMGRLVIEGQAIECLVLEKRASDQRFEPSNRISLNEPESSVSLPVGEYRVQEVRLRGGYRCFPPGRIGYDETDEITEVGWFSVSPDRPYKLRVGAPLKPTLKVVRRDRRLRMTFYLSDVSGQELWRYLPEDCGREKIASFSVYSGDQLVGSGFLDAFG